MTLLNANKGIIKFPKGLPSFFAAAATTIGLAPGHDRAILKDSGEGGRSGLEVPDVAQLPGHVLAVATFVGFRV